MIATFVALCAIVIGLLWQPGEAAAQPEDGTSTTGDASDQQAREIASKHFRRGVELFQEGAYGAALVEFERAYETLPDYRLHYNIAQTKRLLQDYLGAAQSYERYLREGGDAIAAARQAEVREQLDQLQERIARLSISTDDEGARVYVDDRLVGITPIDDPVAVNVGRHRVVARSITGAEVVKMVEVAGGDELEVHLPVAAEEPAKEEEEEEEPLATAEPQAPVQEERTAVRRFAVSALAVGGTALAAGIATGIVAAVEQNNFDNAVVEDMLGAAERHADRAEASALATDVLLASGLALTVAGLVTWLKLRHDDEDKAARRRSVQWGVGPGSLAIQGEF